MEEMFIWRESRWFPGTNKANWICYNIPGAEEHKSVPAFQEKRLVIVMIDTGTRSSIPPEEAFLASSGMYKSVVSDLEENPVYQEEDRLKGFKGNGRYWYQFLTLPRDSEAGNISLNEKIFHQESRHI
jgi:hypothetical protein